MTTYEKNGGNFAPFLPALDNPFFWINLLLQTAWNEDKKQRRKARKPDSEHTRLQAPVQLTNLYYLFQPKRLRRCVGLYIETSLIAHKRSAGCVSQFQDRVRLGKRCCNSGRASFHCSVRDPELGHGTS